MSLFSERLMKWREPKMKGMVTPDCIYLNRDGSSQGQNFSIFSVVMKNDVIEDDVIQFSYATFRSVHQFTVPESVNVEQVLQILRDKGVKVVERPQSS
jgi:hypothetical protein